MFPLISLGRMVYVHKRRSMKTQLQFIQGSSKLNSHQCFSFRPKRQINSMICLRGVSDVGFERCCPLERRDILTHLSAEMFFPEHFHLSTDSCCRQGVIKNSIRSRMACDVFFNAFTVTSAIPIGKGGECICWV